MVHLFRSVITVSRASGWRNRATAMVSGVAMAVAVLGTASVGSAVLSVEAKAQMQLSRSFSRAYQPVADLVNAETPNMSAARAQVPAMVAAIDTPQDRMAAGNLMINIGGSLEDVPLQRQGLELMLQSNLVAEEQLGLIHFFLGRFAIQMGDHSVGRDHLQRAIAAGHTEDNPQMIIAASYQQEGNHAGAVNYLLSTSREQVAAGRTPPEAWLLEALQTVLSNDLTGQVVEVSQLLIEQHPQPINWTRSLQVIDVLHEFNEQQRLDLLRLMRQANAMDRRNDFIHYIEIADPRIMANELGPVLQAGLDAGHFTANETYYTEVRGIIDQRAASNRSSVDGLIRDARRSNDAQDARDAADALFSISDYAQAEEFYRMAVDNGLADRELGLTRLGISQLRQGKTAEAQATFDQIQGARAPIAQMWALYARQQRGG